jgi:phospholipid N-methyltransferase
MSAIFFKRFLKKPLQVASIIPSSKTLIHRVSSKFDFSEPRVFVEFGPGEGCHTRELVRRMHPDSQLLLFELDPHLAQHLEQQFRHEPRVHVINADAQNLPHELAKRGLTHCDYVLSGIPFSILEKSKKRELLRKTFEALAPKPSSAFVIYQVTNELRQHATIFPSAKSEYCLQNIPPMFITVFRKLPVNGHVKGRAHAASGHHIGRH